LTVLVFCDDVTDGAAGWSVGSYQDPGVKNWWASRRTPAGKPLHTVPLVSICHYCSYELSHANT